MKVTFSDKALERIIYSDKAGDFYPLNVLQCIKRKITILACASDETDLLNLKSLGYESMTTAQTVRGIIHINDKWYMLIHILGLNLQTAEILSIESI